MNESKLSKIKNLETAQLLTDFTNDELEDLIGDLEYYQYQYTTNIYTLAESLNKELKSKIHDVFHHVVCPLHTIDFEWYEDDSYEFIISGEAISANEFKFKIKLKENNSNWFFKHTSGTANIIIDTKHPLDTVEIFYEKEDLELVDKEADLWIAELDIQAVKMKAFVESLKVTNLAKEFDSILINEISYHKDGEPNEVTFLNTDTSKKRKEDYRVIVDEIRYLNIDYNKENLKKRERESITNKLCKSLGMSKKIDKKP